MVAPKGREEEAPVYVTKHEIHRRYKKACEETNSGAMKPTSFQDTWRQCVPHIRISSPSNDVCQRCDTQRNRSTVNEEEKLDASRILQLHIQV